MAVSEQAIQDGVDAIHAGTRFTKYMEDYSGPEDKDELRVAIRCRIIEDYPDDDLLAYISSTEAHIAKLGPGAGRYRHQEVLNALNAEKTNRGI